MIAVTDTDNNGYLDKTDFENLALRCTILENKGSYDKTKHEKNKQVMTNLWNELAELADYNKVKKTKQNEIN